MIRMNGFDWYYSLVWAIVVVSKWLTYGCKILINECVWIILYKKHEWWWCPVQCDCKCM